MRLIQDETNPEKIQIANLPPLTIPIQKREADTSNRVAFLIRKPNLFVFKIRYRITGENLHTKKPYSRWLTLTTFTASLNKQNRLNLFISGVCSSRALFLQHTSSIKNITRNPQIVLDTFRTLEHSSSVSAPAFDSRPERNYDDGILELLQEEFDSLYRRNGLVSRFTKNVSTFRDELYFAAYPALEGLGVPPVSPPLCATDAMRHDYETFVDILISPKEHELRKMLLANPQQYLRNSHIVFLMLSKKRLTEQERIRLLEQETSQQSSQIKTNVVELLYRETYFLSFQNLMRLRAILKAIPTTHRAALLNTPLLQRETNSLLNRYKFLTKRLNKSWSAEHLKHYSWNAIARDLEIKLMKANEDSTKEQSQQVILPDMSYSKIGDFHSHVPWPGLMLPSKRYEHEFFTISSSPATNEVKKTTNYYFTVLREIGLGSSINTKKNNNALLTYVEYKTFKEALIGNAKKALVKKQIEPTDQNVRHYLTAQHVMMYDYKLANRFNGFVPSKWFGFFKQGHDPEAILVLLLARIPLKISADWSSLPIDWIKELVGYSNKTSDPLDLF